MHPPLRPAFVQRALQHPNSIRQQNDASYSTLHVHVQQYCCCIASNSSFVLRNERTQ